METKGILYIGNKLSNNGSTVTSIETLGGFLMDEGFIVYTASSKTNKVLRLFDMLFQVIRKRKKVSVVLIDSYSTTNFYFAVSVANLCRLLRLAYIPILRGGNLPDRLKKNKYLSWKLFNGAKKCVAPSKYLLDVFVENGYNNIAYIPNTIQIEYYSYKERHQVNMRLLWVRSFSQIYNPELAIEIVSILKEKGHLVSLCMIGPEKDGSLQICEQRSQKQDLPIIFTGKLSKKEWHEISEEYDIFINTTNFDNTPVSVIEAMALGLPVISTNVGGLPYLIDHDVDGILVEPNDPNVFVDAVLDLVNNHSKAFKISSNARDKVEKFDWNEVKNKWFELLND